ncbi:hypothetical protein Tco_1243245 [Tanacetum coccineum]
MANKHSIMTREMVESFCNSYYIPDEVHPTAPGRDRTITQFPEGKVGVYTRLFDYCGYRIPLTKFFVAVLKHFRIHISQLSPFGAARVSHFEVLTRVLNLAPSVAVFRAFYTRIYSDGLFSFAKRSLSAPSCLSKPPDSIKNWADHFFWVDSKVFPISVPLYMGGALEKDPAPHLTARQEQAVQVLSTNKAPFRRYPECFLVLVGLSLYYPFDENTYPAFERPDKTDMGLLDYIRTADPRKVQAVEVQKGEEQVKLLNSIKHCFVSLDAPAVGTTRRLMGPEGNLTEPRKEFAIDPCDISSVSDYLEVDSSIDKNSCRLYRMTAFRFAQDAESGWETSSPLNKLEKSIRISYFEQYYKEKINTLYMDYDQLVSLEDLMRGGAIDLPWGFRREKDVEHLLVWKSLVNGVMRRSPRRRIPSP